MFAKRAKESKPEQRPQDGAGQTAESGKDPRDGVIKQLEQQLAEERKAAAALREALDASTFKLEILEKSYAKQLADARERLTKTEAQLADKQKVLAAFDGGHEEALRALTEARAELKQANAERDELRKQVAQGGYRQRDERGTRVPLGLQGDQAGGTINQLIANAGWAEKKSPAVGAGHSTAQVADQESPHEEMIAPDLVFTKKDRDDDGGAA